MFISSSIQFFLAMYGCSKQKFCKLGMNMSMMELGILPSTSFTRSYIWNSCFFDSLFCYNNSLLLSYNQETLSKQLLFQQTIFFVFVMTPNWASATSKYEQRI